MDEGQSIFLPSRDLTHLGRKPSVGQIESGLWGVAAALGVSVEPEIVFDRPDDHADEELDEQEDQDEAEHDFELRHVRNWLTKIVASDLHWVEDAERKERAVSKAAELLAVCAGKSASGTSQVKYTFETPASTSVTVRSREATLTEDALGGRTWGAAPLLAQFLLNDPRTVEMLQSATSTSPVRVLELGAGTGIVGIAIGRLHSATHTTDDGPTVELVLTDHHPNVLANLDANLALNDLKAGTSDRSVTVCVRRLDWQAVYESASGEQRSVSYSSPAQTLPKQAQEIMDPVWLQPVPLQEDSVDIIIAADCVYDSIHPTWIRAVAERYLRRPSPERAGGVMHMISPLRATHQAEIQSYYDSFPVRSKAAADQAAPTQVQQDQLAITTDIELSGFDDFGPPRLRLGPTEIRGRRMCGNETMFRRFEIEWAAPS